MVFPTLFARQVFEMQSVGRFETGKHKTAMLSKYIKNNRGDVEHTLYSWDGRGALNEIRDFKGITREQFSFTPVPASEGNALWPVILADYNNFDMGLFGLGISWPETITGTKVLANGLPSDLSTGGIVGIAVGAVALVVTAGFAVHNWRHRLKNKKHNVVLSKIDSRA
ncbi:hypothetical protein BG005_003834 [Podila minutissima]|nr:hypothetical protein BG005_003834 [Podila minutissima]